MQEICRTGTYTGMSFQENIDARQQIEDLVGLERFYEIEEATVEEKNWGSGGIRWSDFVMTGLVRSPREWRHEVGIL